MRTDNPADVVQGLFETMQARDWEAAENLLSPVVRIEWPATRETFDGPNFLAMQRAYPEGWKITIVEAFAADERVAARVRVMHDNQTFWCTGFYTVDAGRVRHGVEHWLTEGADTAPHWRRQFQTRLA